MREELTIDQGWYKAGYNCLPSSAKKHAQNIEELTRYLHGENVEHVESDASASFLLGLIDRYLDEQAPELPGLNQYRPRI